MPVSKALAELFVRSRTIPFERKVRAVPAITMRPNLSVIFLNAKLYLGRVGVTAVVGEFRWKGIRPPIASVFVSNNVVAARHVDFTCQRDYLALVAKYLILCVRERHPSVREVVLAGLSLSGLAAVLVATQFSLRFAAVICQLPSFRRENGRFFMGLSPCIKSDQKLWSCVGDRETKANVSHPPTGLFQVMTQIEGCDADCAALRPDGYDVRDRKYSGDHDPMCWRADLQLALSWDCRNCYTEMT